MSEHEKIRQLIQLKEQRPLALDGQKTALLIIDVQADFVDGRHAFGQTLEAVVPGVSAGYFQRVRERVIPNIRMLQDGFRQAGLPIFYTGTGTRCGNGKDLALWLREFDDLGRQVLGHRVWPSPDEAAWQISEEIKPLPNEPVVNKTAADPLMCTSLLHALRTLDVENVVVGGLTTDVCVASTARACADQGFQTVIAGDACTTLSAQLHEASLLIFSLAFGRVRLTAEILELLRAGVTSEVADASR